MAAFVDTNILIYAFVRDIHGSVDKADSANDLIATLLRRRELIVSGQVLGEFSANALRKGKPPLSVEQTAVLIQKLAKHTVIPIDASLVQLALRRVQQSRISYWDALIVEAALRSGASILYTEDMDHGTRYGSLELRNPFLA